LCAIWSGRSESSCVLVGGCLTFPAAHPTEESMAIEQRRKMPGLVFPVVLILVGILWLLDNLNMTGGNWFQSLVRFWPLLLVLWGLENWITERGITGPVILIGIGGCHHTPVVLGADQAPKSLAEAQNGLRK
jgi:hypothetical protein